jgi:hypothetical protein
MGRSHQQLDHDGLEVLPFANSVGAQVFRQRPLETECECQLHVFWDR